MLKELRYLGHIFSFNGVTVDPKKTFIVQNFPRPTTVKQVRSFLGLCNFFRRQVYHYADKAHGLIKLLGQGSHFIGGGGGGTRTFFSDFRRSFG